MPSHHVENPDVQRPARRRRIDPRFREPSRCNAMKNGLEKMCRLLPLCRRLPFECIYIEAAENTARMSRQWRPNDTRRSTNIDYNRCIFCPVLCGGLPYGCDYTWIRL